MTSRVLAACAGFLLAVLWMDLMFDVQVLRHRADLPEPVLASIASYYHRVTTDSWPMGALIGAVMAVGVGGALWQAIRAPGWRHGLALVLIVVPVGLALGRVFQQAVRLGLRGDPAAVQGDLARAICTAHLVCLACIVAFLALQLRGPRR